jgi:ABC-type transport system involved in cytochrome c biogenesis permease subunit
MHIVIAALFVLHTTTLGARWFISGHAPWSNAYEAIVYVVGDYVFWHLTLSPDCFRCICIGYYIYLQPT